MPSSQSWCCREVACHRAPSVGARIGVETSADGAGGSCVARVAGLVEEDQQQVARQHGVERVEAVADLAVRVNVSVGPTLDVAEVALVAGALIDLVLA